MRAALAAARAAGATCVLNPAPADGLDAATIALADVLTPNEGELALLAGPSRAARGRRGRRRGDRGRATGRDRGRPRCRSARPPLLARDAGRAVVVTLGAAGALAVPADGQALAIPALQVGPGGHDRRRRRVQRARSRLGSRRDCPSSAARQAVAAAGLSTTRAAPGAACRPPPSWQPLGESDGAVSRRPRPIPCAAPASRHKGGWACRPLTSAGSRS